MNSSESSVRVFSPQTRASTGAIDFAPPMVRQGGDASSSEDDDENEHENEHDDDFLIFSFDSTAVLQLSSLACIH